MSTLYHISYDAKDAADSENLRKEIPLALLKAEKSIVTLTEPVRSTFRVVAKSGEEARSRILETMSTFLDRCYYFVSGSDAYVSEGRTYYPSKTEPNEGLNEKFQKILEEAKNGTEA